MSSLKSLLHSFSKPVIHVERQVVNSFYVAVAKTNKFQIKIALKVVPENTKSAYIRNMVLQNFSR